MNPNTMASGGGGVLAGAVVILLSYALSFWHIVLPPDVVTALTVLLYFFGHRYLSGKMIPPDDAPAVPVASPTPPTPPSAPVPQGPPIYPQPPNPPSPS